MKNWWKVHGAGFSGEMRFDEPLSKHTTYRIGGLAKGMAFPKSKEDLLVLHRMRAELDLPLFFLGAGSNVLASDEGFPGLIVKTSKMNLVLEEESRTGGKGTIQAGASISISTFLNRASTLGWGGLEFLSGIPGTVGGVAFMNGGTHLGETSGSLREVTVFRFSTGEWRVFSGGELSYSYRENHYLAADDLVWETKWDFTPSDPLPVKTLVDQVLARRKATQPLEAPSCGSVFRNPDGMRAWEVIEKLGLRGHRIGGAGFSEKHPNWIMNLGGAQASDVRALIELAKKRSRSELGVSLQEEVKFLGAF